MLRPQKSKNRKMSRNRIYKQGFHPKINNKFLRLRQNISFKLAFDLSFDLEKHMVSRKVNVSSERGMFIQSFGSFGLVGCLVIFL